MKLVTVQHKEVINTIMREGIYKLPLNNHFGKSASSKYYKDLSQYLKYDNSPIFTLPVNSRGLAWGTAGNALACYEFDNFCCIELDVSDAFCTNQNFNLWSEYIDGNNIPLKNTFTKCGKRDVIQTLIPYIKAEWVVAYSYHPYVVEAFTKYHIMVGEGGVAETLNGYIETAMFWLENENDDTIIKPMVI